MSQYPASIKYTAETGWVLPPAAKAQEAASKSKSAPKRKPRAKSKSKE